jgi:hypothetical protein
MPSVFQPTAMNVFRRLLALRRRRVVMPTASAQGSHAKVPPFEAGRSAKCKVGEAVTALVKPTLPTSTGTGLSRRKTCGVGPGSLSAKQKKFHALLRELPENTLRLP